MSDKKNHVKVRVLHEDGSLEETMVSYDQTTTIAQAAERAFKKVKKRKMTDHEKDYAIIGIPMANVETLVNRLIKLGGGFGYIDDDKTSTMWKLTLEKS